MATFEERQDSLIERLVATGLATDEASPIVETVTVSAHYRAENGYYYYVAVDGGNRTIDWLGKSAELLDAQNQLTRKNILDLPGEEDRYERGLRAFFPNL